MNYGGWRRFRPVKLRRDKRTVEDLVEGVHLRLAELGSLVYGKSGHLEADQLDRIIEEQAVRVSAQPSSVEWFTLLVLRAPAAARAQQKMDKNPNGYHDKEARLYELIDFNDTFVSTVLALNEHERIDFIDVAKREIARFCGQAGSHMFSDEQYEAITRGLSREVAVYLGALEQGFSAVMTTRRQDAMGVDMVITDPVSGRSLNVDCKTSSSFHYRIKDLVEQGRLSEQAGLMAEELGYAHELNGHGVEQVAVTLLRVDPNEMGDINNFVFTQPYLLGERVRALFSDDVKVS